MKPGDVSVGDVPWLSNIYALAASPDFARDQTLAEFPRGFTKLPRTGFRLDVRPWLRSSHVHTIRALTVCAAMICSPSVVLAGDKEDVATATRSWADAMTTHDADRVTAHVP